MRDGGAGMAKVSFAATVAAFAAGVALAAPLPSAIAHADGSDSASAQAEGSTPADGGSTRAGAAGSGHASRRPASRPDAGSLPAVTRGGTDFVSTAIRDAVTRPRHGSGADTGTDVGTMAPPAGSAAPSAAGTPAMPSAPSSVRATRSAEPVDPSPVAGLVAHDPAPAAVTALPQPAAPLVPPARSPAASALTTVSPRISANASSSASLIDNLLAPIRTIFGEGTALLLRRTLFNEAPSVTPVQLTGQSDGPITGTIGAVDPDGDSLSYSVTGNPRYGSAVLNSDGTYTYTPATGFTGNDSFVVAVTDTGFHINLLDLFRPASTSASVAVSQGALASLLRFQFVYGSGSQYWSSAARSALESAATQLSSYIVVTSPVTITYAVTAASAPFTSTLASAGSDFIDDGNGFLQTVVQNKIQSGADANGSAADGTIDWNFGPSWALGSSVSSGEYDFQSIAMHELVHTLGFLSNIEKAGSNTGRTWTVYDSYVVNAAGVRAINGDYTWNSAFGPNLTGSNSGLYFGGPQAVAAYLGKVPLYTPNPWASGSSLSHLSLRNTLMSAIVSKGPGPRVLSPVELGVLADIGYTVNSGPPALLFVGFVTIRVRRRKH